MTQANRVSTLERVGRMKFEVTVVLKVGSPELRIRRVLLLTGYGIWRYTVYGRKGNRIVTPQTMQLSLLQYYCSIFDVQTSKLSSLLNSWRV